MSWFEFLDDVSICTDKGLFLCRCSSWWFYRQSGKLSWSDVFERNDYVYCFYAVNLHTNGEVLHTWYVSKTSYWGNYSRRTSRSRHELRSCVAVWGEIEGLGDISQGWAELPWFATSANEVTELPSFRLMLKPVGRDIGSPPRKTKDVDVDGGLYF